MLRLMSPVEDWTQELWATGKAPHRLWRSDGLASLGLGKKFTPLFWKTKLSSLYVAFV